jgi:hypothetical protein
MTALVLSALALMPATPLAREVDNRTAPLAVSAALNEDGRLAILIPTQVVKDVLVLRLIGGQQWVMYESVQETVYRQRVVNIDRVRVFEATTGEISPEHTRSLFKVRKHALIVSDLDQVLWREPSNRSAAPTIVLVVRGWKSD